MLRVSELAAWRVGDIARTDDDTATVTVRRSKTDQEGEGAVLYLGAPTAARIAAWLDAAGVSPDDTDAPLFQRIDRGHTPRGPLSARSVRPWPSGAILGPREGAASWTVGTFLVAGPAFHFRFLSKLFLLLARIYNDTLDPVNNLASARNRVSQGSSGRKCKSLILLGKQRKRSAHDTLLVRA